MTGQRPGTGGEVADVRTGMIGTGTRNGIL